MNNNNFTMEINEIKQQLNILSLVESYGLTPNGNKMLKCPFHEDETASLLVYSHTNTWHCFGCDKGTDVIDFIEFKEKCTTHQALEKAKTFLTILPTMKGEAIQRSPRPQITESQRIETLTKAFSYFSRSTKSEAKTYLSNRCLSSEKLTVGFDNHSFHKAKDVTKELKELYLNVGLVYADKLGRLNSFHSFFDNCIVFPTFNEKGEIVNLYGRCIDDSRQNKHRYLPGKHQGIYPSYPKSATTQLIITEKIIDAATLLHIPEIVSKYSVLALFGANNFTEEMQKVIKDLKYLDEIIFFFDGDKAGTEANQKHFETLKTQLSKVKFSYVQTPQNEDINSLSQLYGTKTAAFIMELLGDRKSFLWEKDGQDQVLQAHLFNPLKENSPKVLNPDFSVHKSTLNVDNAEQLIFKNEYIRAFVWGGIDFYNVKKLRVTLHLQSKVNHYLEYRDTVDLYSNSNVQRLIRESSEQLEIGTSGITKTVSELTKSLEQYRNVEREKERKRKEAEKEFDKEIFTAEELKSGIQFLQESNLMELTEKSFNKIGLIGEENKGILLYFIFLTRMFNNPLHALVLGKSGNGKTHLLQKTVGLLPSKHVFSTTALTENTLYHSLKEFWKNRVLFIEDLDGAFQALLPLREFMSNQSISKMSTEKNLKTGKFEPMRLHVEGPICVAGATTKDSIYEDNANRSFLIEINDNPAHQERVLEHQRLELSGLLDLSEQKEIELLFKTAQLHLEPMDVKIPFGQDLRIPDYVFKKLRTNVHYMTLIKSIAFWHQKQREIKETSDGTRYIEACLDDVEWANRLSWDSLLRKSDELDGSLRGFFESLKKWLKSNKKENFYAKQIREKFRMNPMQVNRYLRNLEQRGYIKQSGGNRKTGFEFSVSIWDDYEQLKAGMNILDETLKKLRIKYSNRM